MPKAIFKYELLFEIEDVLGKKIRTTKDYWEKIKTVKGWLFSHRLPDNSI